MVYTKEKFKELWDSGEDGGGLTYDDMADCAEDWDLLSSPKTHPIDKVYDAVLNAANCE